MSEAANNVAVIGAGGGIGGALVDALLGRSATRRVVAASRKAQPWADSRVTAVALDITDEPSIAAAAAGCETLDAVIVATGTLHSANFSPEKSWRDLSADALLDVYRINAVGPALVAKHFLPLLGRDQRSVFAALSARVGSIGDNRLGGWYAYRASKAALNMLIKSLAIEYGRRNRQGVVVGLHPGTVDTPLSAPFQGNVPDGKLFTAEHSAGMLLDVVEGVTAADSGRCFAYDGTPIDP